MDEVARLAIESSQCLGGGRTRIEPMGYRVLLGDNAVQLLQPPVVRLVQVDDRPRKAREYTWYASRPQASTSLACGPMSSRNTFTSEA